MPISFSILMEHMLINHKIWGVPITFSQNYMYIYMYFSRLSYNMEFFFKKNGGTIIEVPPNHSVVMDDQSIETTMVMTGDPSGTRFECFGPLRILQLAVHQMQTPLA